MTRTLRTALVAAIVGVLLAAWPAISQAPFRVFGSGTDGSAVAITAESTGALDVHLSGGSGTLSALTLGTSGLLSGTAPTVKTSWGTGDAIGTGSIAASFTWTVGTSPSTSGALTLPTVGNGWSCFLQDQTSHTALPMSASSTTSVTFTGTVSASDVLVGGCVGH